VWHGVAAYDLQTDYQLLYMELYDRLFETRIEDALAREIQIS